MNSARMMLTAFVILSSVSVSQAQSFNEYILKSVKYLYTNRKGGGYDISKAFSHDIAYGTGGQIKASAPPLTMCVAAVSEVIIYATKIYADEQRDTSVYDKVPITAWTRGTPLSLRANIFVFNGTGSRGTGHTLARFGLGDEKRFRDLDPGDFINFNRTNRTGHAVVFLGYLRPDQTLTDQYSDEVVGFRYFSAQGRGRADAGFAYRNAFFGNACPAAATNNCLDAYCPIDKSVPRDCGIIRSDSRVLLNAGQMWAPAKWDYLNAVQRQRAQTRSLLEDMNPTESRGAIDLLLDQELNRSLEWTPEQERAFDSSGTD